ncbi:MAG TPA: dTDP-4-dehydrorhamnose 3,5-epimerase family protein [Acidimicrobiia bacterium]|nr:dTDP-4-dehydrorhamnose 3,5-epimerase family protein [Acidimicrobiia bacterium]
MESQQLFPGVDLRQLVMHPDQRGVFTEVFRREWGVGLDPVQWNVVRSEPGVLRGVHVHLRHADYLLVVEGLATIGLRDLRQGSPTQGRALTLDLDGKTMVALTIPVGVAHGFLFHSPSIHVYAVSHYWDPDDEFGCHWGDPELEIDWPFTPSIVSARDAAAGSLSDLLARLAPFQPIG